MSETLDRITFERWMLRIAERLDRHEQILSTLTGRDITDIKQFGGERLLDNQDLCELLNTSKRSLQRYRSEGALKYQLLRHKVYYKESDVQEFLKDHFEEFQHQKEATKKKR